MPVIGTIEAQPFIELHFRLEDGVTAERVGSVFGAIPDLQSTGPSHWLWLEDPPADSAPATPAVDEPSVLGMITLDDRHLDVRLRSGSCTAQAQAVLAPVLLALAGPPLRLGLFRRGPLTKDLPAPARSATAASVRVEPVLMRGDTGDDTDRSSGDDDRMVACLVTDRQVRRADISEQTGKSAAHWLWSIPRAATRRR